MDKGKGGIRLSEKHGLNPTLVRCFVCGEDTGELALMGRLPGDAEAPRRMALNKRPCEKCRGLMAQGVVLISTRNGESGEDPYRTGGWCVIKEEAFRRMFGGDAAEQALKARMVYVPDEVWDAVGLPRGPVEGVPGE
jgi:hypothetical protein